MTTVIRFKTMIKRNIVQCRKMRVQIVSKNFDAKIKAHNIQSPTPNARDCQQDNIQCCQSDPVFAEAVALRKQKSRVQFLRM